MKSTGRRRDSALNKNLNQQKTLILNLRTTNFTAKAFKEISDIDRCVNQLIYGTSIKKITKGGKGNAHSVFFYIYEDDLTQLQWISSNKSLRDSRIDLKTVTSITEIPTVIKKKKIDQYDRSLLLSIHYGVNEELLLLFDDEETKKQWWCGLQHFVEKAQADQSTIKETSNALAQEIFARADADGSSTLNKNEIRQIFKDMQIYMKNKAINDIIEEYDTNKNGKIDFEEFKNLVKKLLRKEELVPIFKKYTVWKNKDYSSPVMTLLELLRFFQEEQMQDLTIDEIRKFNPAFKDVNPSKACISFDMFNDLIFSLMNTIFNPELSIECMDMSRPLTDYYVNSSHNTYLMANQITGESSVHAYINALLKGCRCVEIDLWNGPNAEPIIYHGHTMTSKISFKDVIVALKEHAFKQNPYPLILSFEMHCDLKGQHRIVEILQAEIGDMIYVLPDDFSKYEYYPSPESLKNKFVIKGKGKLLAKHEIKDHLTVAPEQVKILPDEDNKHQENEQQPKQEEELDEQHFTLEESSGDSLDQFDSPTKNHFDTLPHEDGSPAKLRNKNPFFDDDDNVFAKMKNINLRSTLFSGNELTVRRTTQKEESGDFSPMNSFPQASTNRFHVKMNNQDDLKMDDNSFEDGENQKVSERMVSLQQNHYFVNRPGHSIRFLSPINSERNNESPTQVTVPDKALNGSVSHIKRTSQTRHSGKKNLTKVIKVLPELNALYSMIGRKMDFHSRKIWEISSLHEGKIAKLFKNRHKTIVDFHKRYLSRVYPTGSRIDSSNYDPVVSWAAGSQMVALNVQTHDEPMLLNYAKFSANGNTGYVLKPRYLRHNTLQLQNQDLACYPRDLKNPCRELTVRIISGQQIRPDKYNSKEIIDPYVEVKIHGLEVDEHNNPTTFRTQTIKDNGFHPYWGAKENSNIFKFKISAPDFCTLVFQVYDEDIVGRDKVGCYPIEFNHIQQGFRVVPILNSRFQPIKHSYIFCHISITKL